MATGIEIIPPEPEQCSYLRREAPSLDSTFFYYSPWGSWDRNTDLFLIAKPRCQTGKTQVSIFRISNNFCIFQQLHRTWHLIESFAASFVALNFIGGVRRVCGICSKRSLANIQCLSGLQSSLDSSLEALRLYGRLKYNYTVQCQRGSHRYRSSYIITIVFMLMTAFVLAEICSALPLSGSIYIWAAESAGPKYARFFGFLVAWWACTAWMTFTASNCQVCSPCKRIPTRPNVPLPDSCQLYRLADGRLGGKLP